MIEPSLQELRFVVEVARLLSYRRAALHCGVSASRISRVIKAIEQEFDVQLFRRTTRSVALTEQGKAFVEQVRQVIEHYEAAFAALSARPAQSDALVRVSVSASVTAELFDAVVEHLLARDPALRLDITTDPLPARFRDWRADAGIAGQGEIPVGTSPFLLAEGRNFVAAAAPAYVRRRGIATQPEELGAHDCIVQRVRDVVVSRWNFECDGRRKGVDVSGRVVLDSHGLALSVACAGIGVTLVEESVAETYFRAGRLEPVLPAWRIHMPATHLFVRWEAVRSEQVRRLLDALSGFTRTSSPRTALQSLRATASVFGAGY